MSRRKDHRCERAGGFTLVEVMVTVTLFAIVTLAMGAMMSTGQTSVRSMDEQASAAAAHTLMGRIGAVRFGTTADGLPSEEQVLEFFDDDMDVGSISFMQVVNASAGAGFIGFSVTGLDGYGKIVIGTDLNDDGDISDLWEGQDDLYRIDIYYDDVLILRTYRSS